MADLIFTTAADRLRGRWVSLVDRWISRRIEPSEQFEFTTDYCAGHVPVWERELAPFRGRADVRMLEVGCFEGRATLWFLQNILTHSGASMTCIDSFVRVGGEPRFSHNLRVAGLSDKVRMLKGRSDAILAEMGEERFDIVYIDGSHIAANVLMDAIQTWLLLQPGGILIFDDYAWRPDRPIEARPQLAIDAFLAAFGEQLKVLHKDYQVIVRKEVE